MYCYLCLTEYAGIFETYCGKCKKIKHYISLYGDRVHEVLDNVLSRSTDKQDNKIKCELQTEIQNKEYALRSKKQIKRGTEEN